MNKIISFVIPVKDEQDSLLKLSESILKINKESLPKFHFELIFIDDGSIDKSWEVLKSIKKTFPKNLELIKFRKNMGKSLALNAGFSIAKGDIVFTMDADLQDDPNEIPKFIKKINEGYDLVSGWKEKRNDPLSKTIPSKFFNFITAKVSGLKLQDFNCGFKAYKKEVIDIIDLYGELHRYVPILANHYGFKVGEISVTHHERQFGKSKFGIERYIRGLLDLISVMAITKWSNKPGHLFGGLGLGLGFIGFLFLSYLIFIKLFFLESIGTRPLFIISLFLIISSLQFIFLGITAEFLIKFNKVDTNKYTEK